MKKEKQIREHERKQLLDELSKMPDMVIATAYLEAINYIKYGEDVTNAWNTAIQQNAALEKAYVNGYANGIENTAKEFKYELDQQNSILNKIRAEIEKIAKPNEVGGRGYKKSIRYGLCIALEIIDKYRAESE